ncbi:MAG: type II toxin-antitoxin system RelE/ParE family toxin [Planctomycetaceae bacterium]
MRRQSLERFPYRVIFEVRQDEVRILAIFHHSRQPGYWRSRR